MSYNVLILRREVKEQNTSLEFLENPDSILDFTSEQYEKLKSRLVRYGYQMENEEKEAISFNFKGGLHGITARLYANQLSFSSGFTEKGIFEISQTTSELAGSGLVKLDLQDGTWEEN